MNNIKNNKILLILASSWKSLLSNKSRTALTVLGISIGITSIIVVFSAGEGIRSLVLGQIESFGTNIIQTEIKIPSGNKSQAQAEQQNATALVQGVQITTLTLDDMEDIRDLPNVSAGYGVIMSQEQLSFGNEMRKAMLMGVSPDYIDIDQSSIEHGRFFNGPDDRSLSQVAVLGPKIKDKLFGDSDPIGKMIKIRKSKYRVIGVMEEKGAVMTMDFDDFVYIPVRTMQKKLLGVEHLTYMVHQLHDLDQAEATAEQIRFILRDNHGITDPSKDDFRVTTMKEMLDMMSVVTWAITLLLLAIVTISLLVGGVGIMNIMYVVVNERTKEIGLRKAVGAKYKDVMVQFLLESILITLVGAAAGITVGIIIAYGVSFAASSYGLDWIFKIPVKAYFVSIIFSVLCGVIFGLFPAKKAAKMNPIDALRVE